MSILVALPLALLTVDPESTKGWELDEKDEGIQIYKAEAVAGVFKMKAVGIIDAPPIEVWKAVRDYENYKKTMPYTEESTVISSEDGGKVIHFYSVVNAPFVDRRDYVIKLVDESDWQDGKGYLKVTWTPSDKGPPEKKDLVRVKVNDGMWKLEPRDGGKKTHVIYYVFTDPGGSIPKWIANKANGTAVPNVFKAIRDVTGKSMKLQAAAAAKAPAPIKDGGR